MCSHQQCLNETCLVQSCCVGWIHFFVGVTLSSWCQKIVWALGNLAGDGQELRNDVIEQGIIKPLLHLIYTSSIHLILR